MLFVNNREPKGSIRTKKGRAFTFDLDKNSPANSVYFCERIKKEEYIEVGSTDLLTKIKESNSEQLL